MSSRSLRRTIACMLVVVLAALTSHAQYFGQNKVRHQVENAYLTPRIMKATLDLPPLAVIVALSLGGAWPELSGRSSPYQRPR